MGFSFSATAQCSKCGEYLSSSDEDCDHDGETVRQQMFRHIADDEVVTVQATTGHKWYALERERGDDWIAYEWLGPRRSVRNMLATPSWNDVQQLPRQAMSVDAPADIGE